MEKSKTPRVVPLSNFLLRGFGFVHHSRAILYHQVPNPNITIRTFFIAAYRAVPAPCAAASPGRQEGVLLADDE
jgi:hypothetical protein